METVEVFHSRYRSQGIDKIYGALAKAQGSYKKLVPNEEGPGGKYANLEAIHEATRESTSANGLNLYYQQELLDDGLGASLLGIILGHESGQYIASWTRIIAGQTDRQTGNAIETQKRIHSLMLLGIAPSKNDPVAFDDNCVEQLENYTVAQLKKPNETKKELDYKDTISKDQYNDLIIELEGYPQILRDILETFNIRSLADLPRTEYHPSLQRIRRIKKTEEEYSKKR